MPVDAATLAAFLATTLAIVLSPGPDTMLILRYTMAGGARAGYATVAGVQLGVVVHTVLAAVGLSVVLASSPLLFGAIALAGAAYLAWLGVQSLRSGLLDMAALAAGRGPRPAKALRDALITNLLNPKVILLFLALLPNFIDPERGAVPAQFAVLGLALLLVNTAWQTLIAASAEQARRWLGSPRVQRAVSWATGTVLLVFAALMVAQHVV